MSVTWRNTVALATPYGFILQPGIAERLARISLLGTFCAEGGCQQFGN